jgi:hypothetical protein
MASTASNRLVCVDGLVDGEFSHRKHSTAFGSTSVTDIASTPGCSASSCRRKRSNAASGKCVQKDLLAEIPPKPREDALQIHFW